MSAPEIKNAHDVFTHPFKFKPPVFEERNLTEMDGSIRHDTALTCSHCGSMTIDDAIKAFQTPGTRWSGSDWKYGWPHKFYIEVPCAPYRRCTSRSADGQFGYSETSREFRKFYAVHFKDATPEQIAEWNSKVAPITGIEYHLEGDRLKYVALYAGHQGWGEIDKDGKSFDYMVSKDD